MIPQTGRRCKPFLGKKRPGREKAHGVSSRPGVRTARPVQTPSGKLSAVVWAAGAGFMQGAENVHGAVLWGAPQGRRRAVGAGEILWRGRGRCEAGPRRGPPAGRAEAGRSPAAGAAGAGLRGGWCGGNAWARAGRVRGWGPAGARPAGGPRPGEARPPAPQAPDCGAHPASAERRMVIAEVVRRPPGHGRCRRWPAGFWCADGGHLGPCPAHREPLPPHGRPSWKGS